MKKGRSWISIGFIIPRLSVYGFRLLYLLIPTILVSI